MPHSSPDDGRGGIFKSFDNFVLEVFQAVICMSKPHGRFRAGQGRAGPGSAPTAPGGGSPAPPARAITGRRRGLTPDGEGAARRKGTAARGGSEAEGGGRRAPALPGRGGRESGVASLGVTSRRVMSRHAA